MKTFSKRKIPIPFNNCRNSRLITSLMGYLKYTKYGNSYALKAFAVQNNAFINPTKLCLEWV